ncbi:MAG: FtsX-like permease family protein, partial [Kiritimatiellae bacterium]|nr:FtsX-like permease family protein [Kiritimatiellia bacterium]MDW8457865.1 FtsX-like permease family protein [Verrucomicrobiota bacterium]
AALEQAGLPPLYQTPIVAMRIDELRRRTARGGKREPARDVPEWALRREYRATYRGTLFPTERVIDGRWIDRWDRQSHPPGAAVPISIERSIADTLGLRLGDQVVWDLQGERMVSFIASVREVDWRSMKPNFYIVFPEGAIDRSPKTWALFARTTDPYGAAKAQKLAAERFPNVSVIDLALVLSSVNEVLAGLADAVRGIAWFVVGAGFLVMAGAVRASREQRAREYALLRALGAPLRHLATSWGIEYASVGLFGGLVGTGVGALGGAAAAQFLLKVDPAADPLPLVALPFTLAAATALVGLLAGRGNGASPLECLRRSDV